MAHTIVHTSEMKLSLGGGFAVHIFNVFLKRGSQPKGAPEKIIRAYVVDENRPDFEMISLDVTDATTVEDIRRTAADVIHRGIQREEGLGRLLDALMNDMEK